MVLFILHRRGSAQVWAPSSMFDTLAPWTMNSMKKEFQALIQNFSKTFIIPWVVEFQIASKDVQSTANVVLFEWDPLTSPLFLMAAAFCLLHGSIHSLFLAFCLCLSWSSIQLLNGPMLLLVWGQGQLSILLLLFFGGYGMFTFTWSKSLMHRGSGPNLTPNWILSTVSLILYKIE